MAVSSRELELRRRLDRVYTAHPEFGVRRMVLAWELSVIGDSAFWVEAWPEAVAQAGRAPEIMNTDQGKGFCGGDWLAAVQRAGAPISQDARGRALDNVMVERLWRTVKPEHVYLHDSQTVPGLRQGLKGFFPFYNERCWHQGLANKTPHAVLNTHPKDEPEEDQQ